MVEVPVETLEDQLAALEGEESEARVDALNTLAFELPLVEIPRRLALSREAYALADQLGYTLGKARAAGLEGLAFYLRSEHEDALARLTEGISIFESLGAGDELFPFRGALAGVHSSLGNYEEALSIALDNLRALRAQGDEQSVGWVLHGLSSAYLELGDVQQALDYGMEALHLFTRLGYEIGQGRAHSSVGTALRELGRYDEAYGHHEVSLTLFREMGEPIGESRALNDLGALCQAMGDYAQALDFHCQALALRRTTENRQSQSTSLIAIGQTQVQLGRSEEAITVLHEALDLAESLRVRPHVYRAHEALAEAYEAAGDPKQALHHTRQFHAVREEVLGAQTRGRLQTMQIRMDSERAVREAEIERLRNTELRETNEQLERALTDLQRAQTRLVQSEKLAGLGRLTAGIAHEIKNPLNFVLNFGQLNAELAEDLHAVLLARRTELPADLADELDDGLGVFAANGGKVLDHARRADGIVKSMLGHVRSTGGERRPVDLHQLVDQSIQHVFGGREGDDRVAVERAYDDEVGTVEVVTQSMQRVLVNVLDNARYAVLQQAASAGEGFQPLIRVKTRALPGLVRISVIDNGVGIPAAHCTKVFEPFFTTKPTGEGTGLGLSLSYDIVTQGHDGSMVAISDEGQGATFSITLPVSAGGDGAG